MKNRSIQPREITGFPPCALEAWALLCRGPSGTKARVSCCPQHRLRVASRDSRRQAVSNLRGVLGNRNAIEQQEEPDGRLCQSQTRPGLAALLEALFIHISQPGSTFPEAPIPVHTPPMTPRGVAWFLA